MQNTRAVSILFLILELENMEVPVKLQALMKSNKTSDPTFL
jgi:hypothetical protein